MGYRESGAERRGFYGVSAGAECAEEAWEGDDDERLTRDFRELQSEARSEFRRTRTEIMRRYEERLTQAKQQYLEDAVASREKLLMCRQLAREEYEEALRSAQNDYEFAVDIVKDHYQTVRKETRAVRRIDDSIGEAVVAFTRDAGDGAEEAGAPREKAATRVIRRLDEEIRRVAARKRELAGTGGN